MLDVVAQGSHIRHGQYSRLIELALDGQVKVLGSHGLVLVVVARQVKRHQIAELEVGKRSRTLAGRQTGSVVPASLRWRE